MGALYFGDNLHVLREEIKERPENSDISSGTYNFKKAKKEGKKAKQEVLKGL